MKSNALESLTLAARARLKTEGIFSYREDARLLMACALGWSKEKVFANPGYELSAEERGNFEKLVARRLVREPISRIIGQREFWSLNFKISKDTLDPRPDSETLIEAVLEYFPNQEQALSIVDFGTGSGCLILSLLHEYKQAHGLGIDLSEGALEIATENGKHLGLEKRVHFKKGNWGQAITDSFDVVVSNPPYIPVQDEANLERDVVDFDPGTALFAGPEGLDDYRRLMPDVKRVLKPNGMAFFEIGCGQEKDVEQIMGEAGLSLVDQKRDIQGIIRCLVGQHKK